MFSVFLVWYFEVFSQKPLGHLRKGNKTESCRAAAWPVQGLVSSQSGAESKGRCPLSTQASNIDDVLGHHTSFLDNCLKDCMLTNPELLKVFSRLMSVCVMFTNCMQVRHLAAHPPARRVQGCLLEPPSAVVGCDQQLQRLCPGLLSGHLMFFLSTSSYLIQLQAAASECWYRK